MQTQKFQTVANGLSRWVDGMQGGMGHQERIAARVRLIEVQIEGFKVNILTGCRKGWGIRSASQLDHLTCVRCG